MLCRGEWRPPGAVLPEGRSDSLFSGFPADCRASASGDFSEKKLCEIHA